LPLRHQNYPPGVIRQAGKNLNQAGVKKHHQTAQQHNGVITCVPRIFSFRIKTLATIMPTGDS
jgi:hypothetical protein